MTEMPGLPLWDILFLDGISLVVGGMLVGLLDDALARPGPEPALPPLADPYAEI